MNPRGRALPAVQARPTILQSLEESPLALPVRSQSAFVRGMAENGNQHCPFCSHAIIADAMGVTMKSHLDITVAEQSLYRFRIGLDADEKRCKVRGF